MKNLNYNNIEKYDYINLSASELQKNIIKFLKNPILIIKWFLTKNTSKIIFDLIKDKNYNKINLIKNITNLIYNNLPLTLKTSIVRESIKNEIDNILDTYNTKLNNFKLSKYIYSKLLRKPNIQVFSADNRNFDYIKLSTQHNLEICKKYNFKYKFINDFDLKQYPPYWMKVFFVNKLMEDDSNDYIMWIDSDALLTNNAFEIYNFVESISDKCFFISKDHPDWLSYGINAGVWIIKNNKLGKKFMKVWMDGYDTNKWKFIDNKWKCNGKDVNQEDINSPCPWSGHDFEQGYLNYLIQNNDYIKNNIFIFEYNILNGHNDTKFKNDVIAYHFCGMEKLQDLRLELMKIVVNNF